MNYLLYIKTHKETGLKYLGFTTKDPWKYHGSGKYWIRHLEKYGYNIITEVIKNCNTKEELQEAGRYYSNLWNIVESKDWANLMPEEGDGWPKGQKRGDQNIRTNSGFHLGQNPWNKGIAMRSETKEKLRKIAKARSPMKDETHEKLRLASLGKNTWSKGRKLSEQHKRNIAEGMRKRAA